MRGLAVLTLCLSALALTSAMPREVDLAEQVAKIRLQDLSSEVMEEIVDWFRQELASKSALEIAQFLDKSEAVSLQGVSSYCDQNGHQMICCVDVSTYIWPFGSINSKVCVDGEYLPNDDILKAGVRIKLTVDGDEYINEFFTPGDPPAICTSDVPFLPGSVGSVCLDAYGLEQKDGKFHFCFNLLAKFYIVTLFTLDLGCFDL